ncbi:MAG: nucleotide-binding protein [Bacteroidales bacterium]
MTRIAVAGGKGGTGKTFIAVNMFHVLQRKGYRVMLVDCDAEAPNDMLFFKAGQIYQTDVNQLVPVIDPDKCTFCNKCREYCNYNAILVLPPFKVIQVIEDLCHGCGACSVACSYGAISEKPVTLGRVTQFSDNENLTFIEARMNAGAMSPVPVIKVAIKQIDETAEVAILDSPPGTSCPFIQTVASADYVILVTEPTPFGLSDLKHSIETLKKMDKKFGVIVNRAGVGNKDVHKYLEDEGIKNLLEVSFDKKYAELYSAGKIVAETEHVFAEGLLKAAETILLKHGSGSYKR